MLAILPKKLNNALSWDHCYHTDPELLESSARKTQKIVICLPNMGAPIIKHLFPPQEAKSFVTVNV